MQHKSDQNRTAYVLNKEFIMARIYNFSAGPSALPEALLKEAAAELVEYKTSGMSVMEMSHRSSDYLAIIDKTESDIRKTMQIPDNYKVLFLQGGASLQFAMIPLNLMVKEKKAMYINTGAWTKKAIAEAKKFGTVVVGADSSDKTFNYVPEMPNAPTDIDYYYLCSNNTIYGTRCSELPETGDIPLIADMSSNIMSEPVDVSKYGMIFAGAQKNLGPAGVTLVIIREDLIGKAAESVPTMLDFKTHADADSMFNTPPTYGIYMIGKMMEWIESQGGLNGVYQNNLKKANLIYNFLDKSTFFNATVAAKDRSLMNITFLAPNDEMNAKFVKEATAEGLVNLKGHRSVGGMRASIYNATTIAGVEALVNFMMKFETENQE